MELKLSTTVDFSSMFGVEYGRLQSGAHASCICMHPRQPVIAVGALGLVAEYDMYGAKLGSSEVIVSPVCLAYSKDGSLLIAVLKDSSVSCWHTSSWRRQILLTSQLGKGDRALQHAHLALLGGNAPVAFFGPHGGTTLRIVETGVQIVGRGQQQAQGTFLKTDNKKPIVAMAAFPGDHQLLLQFADGMLAACSVAQRSLTTLWSLQVGVQGQRMSSLTAEAHPLTAAPGQTLILVGSPSGCLAAVETTARGDARILWQSQMMRGSTFVGAGICQAEAQVLTFARDSRGEVRAQAWQLSGSVGSSRMVPLPVAPSSRLLEICLPGHAGSGVGRQEVAEVLMHAASNRLAAQTPSHHPLTATLRACSPLHTPLSFWSSTSSGELMQRLAFPEHLYVVDGGNLAAYNPSAGKLAEFMRLPAVNPATGLAHAAVEVVHSALQPAWLVFLRVLSASGDSSQEASGPEREFTLITERNVIDRDIAPQWFLPGKQGVFVGERDSHFAILANSGDKVDIYAVPSSVAPGSKPSKKLMAAPKPMRALNLPAFSNIFAGPAWGSLPKLEEGGGTGEGAGVLLWIDRAGLLGIGDLNDSTVSLSEGGMGWGNMGAGTSRRGGWLQPRKTLPLSSAESLLQLAWQSLTEDPQGAGDGGTGMVAAALTTARVLIVNANLQVLVSSHLQPTAPPFTSLLWAGPALLITSSAHQVMQLGWDSRLTKVGSLGGGPSACLLGALADRLLVARAAPAPAGLLSLEVSPRHLPILHCLLLAWATLSSSPLLPGGMARSRREMAQLAASYDCSGLETSLLPALAAAGCSDLAFSLASSRTSTHLRQHHQAAALAAVFNWTAALQPLLDLHRRSPTYPKAPMRGSKLQRKLVAAGRAAAAYGQLEAAAQAWQAAGHWAELLPLLALQGDFAALRSLQHNEDHEARVMAASLLATAEPRLSHGTAFQGNALPTRAFNLHYPWGTMSDSGNLSTLHTAPAGMLPAMQVSGSSPVPGADVSLVPRLDPRLLEAYLGVGQGGMRGTASPQENVQDQNSFLEAAIPATAGGGLPLPGGQPTGEVELRRPSAQSVPVDPIQDLLSMKPTPGPPMAPAAPKAIEMPSGLPNPRQGAGVLAPKAQAPVRTSFGGEKDPFYDSSDDEGTTESGFAGLDGLSSAPSTGQKFKVVIRGKDDLLSTGQLPDLKSAAQGLRLIDMPGPMRPPAPSASKIKPPVQFPMQFGGPPQPSASGQTPLASLDQDTRSRGGPVPAGMPMRPPPPASPPLPPAIASAPVQRVGPSLQPSTTSAPQATEASTRHHAAGVGFLESGRWEPAEAAFTAALAAAAPGADQGKQVCYLAACRLLQNQAKSSPAQMALLGRYAAAIPLHERHRRALVQSAAASNMAVANYGYSMQQLDLLTAQSAGTASQAYLSQLAARREACRAKGGSDSTIPLGEDMRLFIQALSSCRNSADVDNCLSPIVTAYVIRAHNRCRSNPASLTTALAGFSTLQQVIAGGLLRPLSVRACAGPQLFGQRLRYPVGSVPRSQPFQRLPAVTFSSSALALQAMAKGKRKADSQEEKSKKQTSKAAKKESEAEDEKEEEVDTGEEEEDGVESGGLVKPITRIRQLKGGKPGKGPVIYWMSRDQRVHDNWALLRACEIAQGTGAPVVIAFNLVEKFLVAGARQFGFMLRGLKELVPEMDKLNISFFMLRGDPVQTIPKLVKEMDAGALVTDFAAMRIGREWRDGVAKKVSIPFDEVDTHNVVPVWETSEKRETGARTIRSKIHKKLPEYLTAFPAVPKSAKYDGKVKPDEVEWEKVIKEAVEAGKEVPEIDWVKPGANAAVEALKAFLTKERLGHFTADRNDPNKPEALSGLSPYLHYGQLGAQRMAFDAKQLRSKYKEGVDGFLEESVVRHLLDKHRDDKREYTYTLEEFEKGETHDELWNAGQMEMVVMGKMHGFMRMYWGKKILEWTKSPEQAIEFSIYLNDKYEIDGRDSNGYVGCMWCCVGIHDQGWGERDVFGKIRYMNYNGCKRKFNIAGYVERIDKLARKHGKSVKGA
ncbi:hypothetical protein WJX74_007756 [Apatococcus lobatus]|uniref:Deoxyribodipyrimidine photo-lyase n=1 Tax=Apatococcus lobatus TaxID=904363 RepID=A0AAW1Q4C0_9CHLO